jgi:hypothetical protein
MFLTKHIKIEDKINELLRSGPHPEYLNKHRDEVMQMVKQIGLEEIRLEDIVKGKIFEFYPIKLQCDPTRLIVDCKSSPREFLVNVLDKICPIDKTYAIKHLALTHLILDNLASQNALPIEGLSIWKGFRELYEVGHYKMGLYLKPPLDQSFKDLGVEVKYKKRGYIIEGFGNVKIDSDSIISLISSIIHELISEKVKKFGSKKMAGYLYLQQKLLPFLNYIDIARASRILGTFFDIYKPSSLKQDSVRQLYKHICYRKELMIEEKEDPLSVLNVLLMCIGRLSMKEEAIIEAKEYGWIYREFIAHLHLIKALTQVALIIIFGDYKNIFGDEGMYEEVKKKVKEKIDKYEEILKEYKNYLEYYRHSLEYYDSPYFLVPPQYSKQFIDSLLKVLDDLREFVESGSFSKLLSSLEHLPTEINSTYRHPLLSIKSFFRKRISDDEVKAICTNLLGRDKISVRLKKSDVKNIIAAIIKSAEARGERVTPENLEEKLTSSNISEVVRIALGYYVKDYLGKTELIVRDYAILKRGDKQEKREETRKRRRGNKLLLTSLRKDLLTS